MTAIPPPIASVAPLSGSGSRADPLAWAYLTLLAKGLEQEAERAARSGRLPVHHLATVRRLREKLHRTGEESSFNVWRELWGRYRRVARRTGSYLSESATVASSYTSMDEFWRDMEDQEQGLSGTTVWDTYEHGRRRQLEMLCAQSYGSESAVLLNSGMAALLCALMCGHLQKGAVVVTGIRSYFETSQLIESALSGLNLRIIRISVDQQNEIVGTLRSTSAAVALFETAVNLPEGPTPLGHSEWSAASPETLFVIDNSVQGALTRWFEVTPELAPRLLVVESCVKYLTQDCMAGVVYGSAELIERCRVFARATGLLLQESAFSYMREGEIVHATDRLLLHSRNATEFVAALADRTSFAFVGSIGDTTAGRRQSRLLSAGVGAPVFVCGRVRTPDAGSTHRAVLNEWRRRVLADGLDIPVRAGFGWPETTVRVYESGVLNQADAPVYLRVSVGIEPPSVIRAYARHLAAAAEAVWGP